MANTSRTTRLSPPGHPACGARPGDLLGGRFLLQSILGSGGQAVVFQAADLQRARATVAVKVARTDLGAAERAEAHEVLRWEGGLLRRLRHPALPRLYKLQSDSTGTWLARDLAPGAPLLQHTRHGPADPRYVRLWTIFLCDLLAYLHSQAVPVVVGDLKPANLVLRPDGTLTLIDLGAASTITRRPPRKPRPRHGTPGYAAPEQLGGHGYDERADIFSLAVCAYELLTGIDPTHAPLQFELDRLDRAAPQFAPALRWALEFSPAQRCPGAAVLRSRLGAPAPTPALHLGMGVSLRDQRDLTHLLQRHPHLLAPALEQGAFAQWLARQPDPTLSTLVYRLRTAQRAAAARRSALDILLSAMAPDDGSPLLSFTPARLDLGSVPLKRWRIWSRPATLTISNPAFTPLSYSLECLPAPNAEVRLLINGRAVRRNEGVLAPGARTALEVIAQGAAGPLQGELVLTCGRHHQRIPWHALGQAGLSVGGQHVARLDDLDLTRTDLVPALEALLVRGDLARWLRHTGRRSEAKLVEQALRAQPDEVERRLLISRLLHSLAPDHFPLLRIRGVDPAAIGRPLPAGQTTYVLVEVENLSATPCLLIWRSRCPWAHVPAQSTLLPPFGVAQTPLQITPARTLHGTQPVALDLTAGTLQLPVVLRIPISAERWWDRLRRLLGGG
jgi:serine/threonine protein kinase